jgi:hypothetical protein
MSRKRRRDRWEGTPPILCCPDVASSTSGPAEPSQAFLFCSIFRGLGGERAGTRTQDPLIKSLTVRHKPPLLDIHFSRLNSNN